MSAFTREKKIDKIYHILVENGTTIQYGNFHPKVIVTVTKNLVTTTVIWVKVTILHCCAIFLPEYGKIYQYFATVWFSEIFVLVITKSRKLRKEKKWENFEYKKRSSVLSPFNKPEPTVFPWKENAGVFGSISLYRFLVALRVITALNGRDGH